MTTTDPIGPVHFAGMTFPTSEMPVRMAEMLADPDVLAALEAIENTPLDLAAAAAEAGMALHDARIARNNADAYCAGCDTFGDLFGCTPVAPSIPANHPSVRALDNGASWADDGAIVR